MSDSKPSTTLPTDPVLPAALSQQVARLASAGLSLTDGIGTITFEGSVEDPPATQRLLEALWPGLRNLTFINQKSMPDNSTYQILRVDKRGETLAVSGLSDLEPAQLFDGDSLEDAEAAWTGLADSALKLPGRWTVAGSLALDELVAVPEGTELRITMRSGTIASILDRMPPWTIDEFFPASTSRRVFIALDAGEQFLRYTDLAFSGPELPWSAMELSGSADRQPRLGRFIDVEKSDRHEAWDAVESRISQAASIGVWCRMASAITGSELALKLTYFGYRSTDIVVDAGFTFTSAEIEDTRALARWLEGGGSADKELATKQVVSLYPEGDRVLRSAADVLRSAQMIFLGLRTEAITETIRAVRDAEAKLGEAVRQSVIAAQTLLKNATERAMAAGIAVAGAIIAKSTDAIPASVGRGLLVAIAVALLVFALWSTLIEAPLVNLQLRQFSSDIASAAYVTEETRKSLLLTPSYVGTQRRVSWVKHAPAVLYVAGALALLKWGVPAIT